MSKRYPGRGLGWFRVDGVEKLAARAAEDGAEPTKRFRLSASSEYPVERMDYWTGRTFREVLDHGPKSVDMGRFASGRAPVLMEHRGTPVGVIESAEIDQKAKKTYTDVRFGRTAAARDAESLLEDEVVTNTSVGYVVKKAQLVETSEEKGDLWRVMLWEPLEVSLVGVPADPTVGADRGAGDSYAPVEVIESDGDTRGKRAMAKKWVRGEGGLIEVDESDPRPAVEVRVVESAGAMGGDDAVKADRERQGRIAELVNSNRGLIGNALDDKLAGWMRDGTSVETVQNAVIAAMRTKGGGTVAADPLAELPAKDRRRFSYRRALLGAIDGNLDGVEQEVHDELARTTPSMAARRGVKGNSVFLPMSLNGDLFGTRTLDTKTIAKGAETVFEQPGELIELLRNRAFVLQLGARLLTGLSGPVAFPRQTGGVAVNWVSETGAAITAADPALGLAVLNPKTLQGATAYSRQFLAQSSLDVEAWVRDELAIAHGLALDKAAIHGAGANGEPAGIYQQTGVNAVSMGGAPTYAKLVEMQTAVAQNNALRGSMGYLTTPKAAGEMKTTLMFTSGTTGLGPIWTGPFDDGEVAGYKAFATNQVSAVMTGSAPTGGAEQGLVFGNWMDCLIGMFAAMEIVVDPYSLKKQGLIEVASFQMCDVLLRHAESFAKTTGTT